MTAGGSKLKPSYSFTLEAIASWGMVVLAPLACPDKWCPAYPDDIKRAFTDTKNLHDVLKHADYQHAGVIGHSMGGNAAVRLATLGPSSAYKLLASVAENPAVMHDPFTRPERINVPTFFETGTAETLCPEAGVVEAYNKDPMHDKVLMDTIGGTHFEETNIGRKRVLPYSVQFLVCHLMDDPKACNYIYGKGKDSLCTIGNVPYKKCHALHSMEEKHNKI